MKTIKENKQYIKGTGARDLQKYFDICKPKSQFRISLNKARSRGGTAFKKGGTAFKNLGSAGGTAFKNPPPLRLRIYRIT